MTFEEAKDLYKKHRCSLFGVFRDEGPEREEFLRVNVPQSVKRERATEFIDEFILKLEQHPDSSYCYYDVSAVIHAHHDEEFFVKLVSVLKKLSLSPRARFSVCDDILGMSNPNTREGLLDYACDTKNQEVFGFLLAYVHDYLKNPVEIPENRNSRFEDMKDVVTEYDKIQARGL